MRTIALLSFFLSSPAFAGALVCRANFDESSHYELTAPTKGPADGDGGADFRYVTEDGIDLSAKLKISSLDYSIGSHVALKAANENMGAAVDAAFDAASGTFRGTMDVNFDLEHAEPLELPATCSAP